MKDFLSTIFGALLLGLILVACAGGTASADDLPALLDQVLAIRAAVS